MLDRSGLVLAVVIAKDRNVFGQSRTREGLPLLDVVIADIDRDEEEGLTVPVIGLRDLIVNKRASGRDKDLLDLKALERIARRKKP